MNKCKSLTKVKKQAGKKTNPELIETIKEVRKNKAWIELARILSSPTRKFSSISLIEIDKNTREGDTIIVPGKVLSSGNVSKQVRICALGFSKTAKEKLKETKSEVVTILEEVKKNPKAQGVRVIR